MFKIIDFIEIDLLEIKMNRYLSADFYGYSLNYLSRLKWQNNMNGVHREFSQKVIYADDDFINHCPNLRHLFMMADFFARTNRRLLYVMEPGWDWKIH